MAGVDVDGQEQATQFVTVFVGEKVRECRSTGVSPDYVCLAEFTFENPGVVVTGVLIGAEQDEGV